LEQRNLPSLSKAEDYTTIEVVEEAFMPVVDDAEAGANDTSIHV
jgi:hypothetical protein